MSTTDWIVNLALVAIVFKQMREDRFELRTLLLPIGLTAWAAHTYLSDVPTLGHDVTLYLVLGVAGVACGVASALATTMRVDRDGTVLTRATGVAAVIWVLGISTRIMFELFSEHGGEGTIRSFSIAHQITGANAWTAALVIMALSEVVSRLVVLCARRVRMAGSLTGPAPVAA